MITASIGILVLICALVVLASRALSPRIDETTINHAAPFGDMPIRRLSTQGDEGISIIYLIGGPGGDIYWPLEDSPFLLMMLDEAPRGSVVYIPAYLGTTHRSLFPRADLPKAIKEVESLIQEIKGNSTSNLCIVAESLGGTIAALAAPESGEIEIALVNTLFDRAEDSILRMRAAPGGDRLDFRYGKYREFDVKKKKVSEGEPKFSPKLDFLRAFFGKRNELTLPELMKGREKVLANATFIYSASDERIGVEPHASLQAKFPQSTLIPVNGNGHSLATPEEVKPFREPLRAFLDKCSSDNKAN